MSELFLKIFNMSITAAWLTLAVIIFRLIFKKAPKYIRVILWGFVALRLVCPFSIQSVLSLIPSTKTLPEEILYTPTPNIHSGISYINSAVNPVIESSLSPNPTSTINPMQTLTYTASIIWLVGVSAMLIYMLLSYLLIYRKTTESVMTQKGIFICDRIDTPFVLGIIRPKIFLPSSVNEADTEYILAHEKAHIKRRDYLWKPIGFLLLSIYWFNPILWIAYILLCRDIELACDEKVISDLGNDAKKYYAEALVNCSVQRKLISACPLAFGETGIKGRIKSVLDYKKPALWIIIAAIIAGIITGVCFLTNPKEKDKIKILSSGSELDGVSVKIADIELSAPSPYIEIEWKNKTKNDIVYGEEFYIYQKVGDKFEDCRIDNDYAWNLLAYYLSPNQTSTKKYLLDRIIMTESATYRFESNFFIEGKSDTKYKVWIEFNLKNGAATSGVIALSTVDIVYDCGMYSYIQTIETAPDYRLVNGMQLQEITKDGLVRELGILQEKTLTKENFDSLFNTGWSDGYSLSEIKKNNKRFWQLSTTNTKSSTEELYILLQQKDGSYYLGFGYLSDDKANNNKSHIRWLYRLKAVDITFDNSTASIVQNGSVYFYSATFEENDFLRDYKGFYQLNEQELDNTLKALKAQKWIYDGLVDRIAFNYDGQLFYDGKWLYFGYEQSVVYYDEYFCIATDEIINMLKGYEEKAKEYSPVKLSSSEFTYESALDIIPPKILLYEYNQSFQFSFCSYSSYLARGKYILKNDRLILETEDGKYRFVFNRSDADLIFNQKQSSELPKFKFSADSKPRSPIPDGAVFSLGAGGRFMPSLWIKETYEVEVSYAGYSSDAELYTASLNSDKLSINHTMSLPIRKFDSFKELEAFKEKFKDTLTFNKGFDSLPSFNLATIEYDEDFFKERCLLLVYVSAPSTDYRYGVSDIKTTDKSLLVQVIRSDGNETGDTAMSGWFITVSAPKSEIENIGNFDAYLAN